MSKFVPGSTGNVYRDRNDCEVSLYRLVRAEPEWACSRIRAGEKAEARVAELEAENARLREAVDLVILKHRVRKERGTLVYFELPSEELEALVALLGGGG